MTILFRVVEGTAPLRGYRRILPGDCHVAAAPRNDNVGDKVTELRTVGGAGTYSAPSFFLCHPERSRGIRFLKKQERILRLRLRLRSE